MGIIIKKKLSFGGSQSFQIAFFCLRWSSSGKICLAQVRKCLWSSTCLWGKLWLGRKDEILCSFQSNSWKKPLWPPHPLCTWASQKMEVVRESSVWRWPLPGLFLAKASRSSILTVPLNCIQPWEQPSWCTALLILEEISVPLGVAFAYRKFAYWKGRKGFGNFEVGVRTACINDDPEAEKQNTISPSKRAGNI